MVSHGRLILSFATLLPFEAVEFSRISEHYYSVLNEILEKRGDPKLRGVSKYLPYAPKEDFWKGFKYSYPFWNMDLENTREMLVSHILEALKRFTLDEARTDQVLCYLVKTRAFKKGSLFCERRDKYKKSLCYFIRDNLANPFLYIYFEVRKKDLALPYTTYSFSDWSHNYRSYISNDSRWIRDQIGINKAYMKNLVDNHSSGLMKKRTRRLLSIHEFPEKYFSNAVDIYIFYFSALVTAISAPKAVQDSVFVGYIKRILWVWA